MLIPPTHLIKWKKTSEYLQEVLRKETLFSRGETLEERVLLPQLPHQFLREDSVSEMIGYRDPC